MKLTILKMNKKKIIGAVCAIALFAGGGVVGAQIYANASSNAIATLPLSKGGTSATTAGAAATSILGTNYANYDGILPASKGGTGINGALSNAISSSSTDAQIPTAKAVMTRAPRVQNGTYTTTSAIGPGGSLTPTITLTGFTAEPNVYLQLSNAVDCWGALIMIIQSKAKDKFVPVLYNNSTGATIPAGAKIAWTAIGW